MIPDNPRGNYEMSFMEAIIKLNELRDDTTYDGYRTTLRIAIEQLKKLKE